MTLRRRPSARLLVIDEAGRVLLFRFVHKHGALAGEDYWATPGGAVDGGETLAEAGRRELEEETGIRVPDIGPEAARREFVLRLSDGTSVIADERYFRVDVRDARLSRDGWTAEEVEVVAEHRWWSLEEIRDNSATIWPERLADMLAANLSRSEDLKSDRV